ncbi:OLC1v1025732C1 [Oldenlandia corymbosa var. corymbosa]|uniref:OLC1v1025732C1 n=1 Tax=Oldenlandia corymbosa var. corymbosa TaxID=529605 RepID=A0AAV1C779_OLDCO|nr:OLC1v1025732C1 [Oldenlandia corymbosa var. corymbosa]
MALQVQVYRGTPMAAHPNPNSLPWSTKQPMVCVSGDRASFVGGSSRRLSLKVRSSLDATADTSAVAVVGQVTEVCKDTFWPIVKAAGDKTVVLDMYTQWCGPCKIIAPKFQELSQKYLDVVFLKLDCNQENKPLAKELGIRVVPTFKILKDNKVVKEVTGAKFDDLVAAIETVRNS